MGTQSLPVAKKGGVGLNLRWCGGLGSPFCRTKGGQERFHCSCAPHHPERVASGPALCL